MKTIAALTLATLLAAPAAAQEASGMVVLRGTHDEDVYLAGGTVDSRARVRGDLTAAGGQVSVAGEVSGDVLAAGAQVDLVGSVGDDVRALGGQVRFAGDVGGDAVAAAGSVGIDADATVGGRALLAGSRVEVAGRVGKSLRAAGQTVILSGEVGGDVEVVAERLEVLGNASIDGTLTYGSPEPARIVPGAHIVGTVTHRKPEPASRAAEVVLGALFLAGSFLVGWVMQALFPRFTLAAARDLVAEPLRCLLIGVALLVGGPLAVAFLLASVVGAPLGLVGGAAWLASLLPGYVLAAAALAELGLRLRGRPGPAAGWRLLALFLALLALRLVRLVPLLGGLTAFAALALGLGALALRAGRVRAASGPRPASGATG
jgi:cytoskeletal protein CcmA (bactofilin family)